MSGNKKSIIDDNLCYHCLSISTFYKMLKTSTIFLLFFMFMTAHAQNLKKEFIKHNNINREYLIYIPESYDESKQHPLLFNFHGGGGTAKGHLQYFDMRKLAEDNKFILIYPQGSRIDGKEFDEGQAGKGGKVLGTHWNPELPSVPHNKSKADDYGFLESMIDKIGSDYSINNNKVYLCGFSNGADFALSAACYFHKKVAAAASVAGLQSGEIIKSRTPTNSKGIIVVHGDSDPTRPYYNGLKRFGVRFNMSVPEILSYWVGINQIDEEPIKNSFTYGGQKIEHSKYLDSMGKSLIEHYKVINGGHTLFDFKVNDKSLNEVIWDFMSKHKIKKPELRIMPTRVLPFTFIFNSENDAKYSLEVSNDLTAWSKLQEAKGTGKQIEFVDSRKAIFQKQYYRVKLVE